MFGTFKKLSFTHSKALKPVVSAAMVLCLAGILALATGCAGGGGAKSETIMTINDSIKVSRGEYDQIFNSFLKQAGGDPEKRKEMLDNKVVAEMLKQTALNKIIFFKLLTAEAGKLGITVSDKELAEFKAENLKELGGEEGLKKLLAKDDSFNEKSFEEELKNNLLIKKFVSQTAGEKVKVGDAEINQFYTANRAQFDLPERIHSAHILIKSIEAEFRKEETKKNPGITNEEMTKRVTAFKAEKKASAQKLYDELKASSEPFKLFDKLAREKSEDPASGAFGGDLSFMAEATTAPGFWKAAKATKPGGLHDGLAESVFGYHIIWVKEYQDAHRQSLAEAKPQIIDFLKQQKMQKELSAWVATKRQSSKIEFTKGFEKPKGFDPVDVPKAANAAAGKPAAAAAPAKAPAASAAHSG